MPPKQKVKPHLKDKGFKSKKDAVQAWEEGKMMRTPPPLGEPGRPGTYGTGSGEPRTGRGSSHVGQRLGGWTMEQMTKAWEEVRDKKKSISMAARQNGIPLSTFKDRVKLLKVKVAEGHEDLSRWLGHQSGGKGVGRIFTEEEEEMLVEHLLVLADGGFGLTPLEFRMLAHDWAQFNGMQVSEGDMMSYNFLKMFVERHTELKILKPMEISYYRATAPSYEVINRWFESYGELIERHNITNPVYIWNIDETGMKDQPKAEKVITRRKGVRLSIVHGERGQLTTVLAFANAAGMVSKPVVILKGKKLRKKWIENKPEGWVATVSKSGWINKEVFLMTGRHFIKYLEELQLLGPQHKHILLLDGHSAHSSNWRFNTLMAMYNVSVVTFPPHATHFLQPYDGCILSLLKRHWQNALRTWNRRHSASQLGKSAFFIPFRRAWNKTMKPEVIQAGFRQTGCWPVNFGKVKEGWFSARKALGENQCENIYSLFPFPCDVHVVMFLVG